MLHANALPGDGIHVIQALEVADATARAALVLTASDIGRVCRQLDTKVFYILENNAPVTWIVLGSSTHTKELACSDETTAVTVANGKLTFVMQHAMTLTSVHASLTVAQTSGALFTVDVKKNGATIFSTLMTFDNTEKSTRTAVTLPVLSTTALAIGDEIRIDVTQVGDGTAKGLKVYLNGKII
jgi:hypothetical protein